MAEALRCPRCQTVLTPLHTAELLPCPACRVPVHVLVFPAWFKMLAPGRPAEQIIAEGESSCFYHQGKQAVVPCDACGRFLCALCDCEIQGQHFCPGCVNAAPTKDRRSQFERGRTNHDSVALSLALISIFVGPFALVLGPAAIFWALWFWRRPPSVLPRTKVRSVAAILISLATTAGWGFWAYKMFTNGNI